MVKVLRSISFLFFIMLSTLARSQQLPYSVASNLRAKTVSIRSDSLMLDTMSIIPKTFFISGIDASAYRLDFASAILYWKVKPAVDSITLSYRVFPSRLNAVVQHLNYDSIARYTFLKPASDEPTPDGSRGLFKFGNLQSTGSFGRSLSFGNKQDAVVNSNFQWQLNGMLGDSIEIAAAITDNNIPIQPDGTTQQLNEFDQVFLQFKKRNWQLNLGDIDIRQNGLYFLNFYKRLEGIAFRTDQRLSPSITTSSLLSGSIAKGKFNRNIFQGLEGNQGPYRLKGANNEFFFIVLAGTERVFLDGEALQRGEDQDYVINYNTAEVTFTPKRMITKDSRIQIEFEYADRNFLNSNLYAFQTVDISQKLKIKIGAFQNSDAKNSQINQTLDERQKTFLFNLGDSVNNAFYPTVILDSFSKDRILYEKIYYTAGFVTDSFYRYSIDSFNAKFALSFTELGAGRGNYVPDFNGANGKVFRFILPIAGLKQGSFEPVMKLVTPKKQQLLSVAADYQVDRNNIVKTEFAISNYDANAFSSRNEGDDRGVAARIQYTNTATLSKRRSLQMVSNIDLEHVAEKFRPLERLRFVEFSREWGLPFQLAPADENIVRFSLGLKDARDHIFNYQLMTYQRSDRYKGYQNIVQHLYKRSGWNFANSLSLTNFNNGIETGVFVRPVIDISKRLDRLKLLRLGMKYALEHNDCLLYTSPSPRDS